MPKALESLVNLHVKVKNREALQSLLERRQSTRTDFERLNASQDFMEELAQEIEIIKAGLDLVKEGDDTANAAQSGEVKVILSAIDWFTLTYFYI